MPDPRLQRVSFGDLPAEMRAAWQDSMDLRGDATLVEVFANHPDLWQWYVQRFYGDLFDGGVVARPFKELLRLRLSMRHGCRFCNQGNRRDALAAGLQPEHVDAILDENSPVFGPAERAILRLADRIALTEPLGILDQDLHAELSECFSDAQVLELGFVAAILTGVAKFLFAYDLVEKEANCPFHPQNPEEAAS